MKRQLRYMIFCIKYFIRKRKQKGLYRYYDEHYDSWWWGKRDISDLSNRMFNREGDIYKAVEKEKQERGELKGYFKDGEDVFGIYKK